MITFFSFRWLSVVSHYKQPSAQNRDPISQTVGNITGKAGNEGAQKIIKIPTLVINDDIRGRPEQTAVRLGISMAVSSCGQDSGFLSLLHFFFSDE